MVDSEDYRFIEKKGMQMDRWWGDVSLMYEALLPAMEVIRSYQRKKLYAHTDLKEDDTLVASAERESEAALMRILHHSFPQMDLRLQERGRLITADGQNVIFYDPLNGIRPFVNNLWSSTIIVALYDMAIRKVIRCFVGEAATGRIWHTDHSEQTYVSRNTYSSYNCCHVWQGALSPGSTVFLDLHPGFKGAAYSALNDLEQRVLLTEIYGRRAAVMMTGSNGLHHALVANGGKGGAGAITTARTGPWDVAGALLVLQAGGAARGFSTDTRGKFQEEDPLDAEKVYFLVTGNNRETVDELSRVFLALRNN